MSKKSKHTIILIGSIRYYADKPDNCRKCFFRKNRKVGCILAGRTATTGQNLS